MTESKLHVTFYREWVAFPHTKMQRGHNDTVQFDVHPNGLNEGGNYGFSIEHIGTGLGTNHNPIGLQLQIFGDAWRAFTDLPELFALLASLDGSQRGHDEAPATLDDLIPRLSDLGWIDDTAKHAARHTHIHGCLTCGERLAA